MKFEQQSPAALARYSREKAEREKQVRETLELINAGWTYRQVAAHHGVAVTTVTKRYKKALTKYLPPQEVDAARRALIDRLDTITRANLELMGEARRDRDLDKFAKVQTLQMALEDRRINVMGLKAPTTLVIQEEKVEATPQETEMQKLLRAAQEAKEARRAAMGAKTEEESAA